MKKLALFLSFLFVLSCTKDPIIYTLTTSANPSDGGTVSPSTQQYDEGKTATITATASSEYLFQSWSGATGSTNSTSVVMNSDKSVTANFVKKKYALTTAVEGEGTVTEKVIKAGAATDYNSGTIVELTATPSGEWLFVEWKGDLTGSENPTQITIDKAKSVTAVFVKKQYPLTIEIEGEGTVSEKVIKVGLATDYNSGTIVELTAEPTGDWEFVGWTGDITSTENPVQITIDEAKTVKANFKFIKYYKKLGPNYPSINQSSSTIVTNDFFPAFNMDAKFIYTKINNYLNANCNSCGLECSGQRYYMNDDNAYVYLDYNNDNKLDVFGFLYNGTSGYGVLKGKYFLVDDVFNDFRISYYDSEHFFAVRMEVNDFNGDGNEDVMIFHSDDHEFKDNPDSMQPLSIAYFSNDGLLETKFVGNKTSTHSATSFDIDQDGDVDIINFEKYAHNEVTYHQELPILLRNNGNGTFTEEINFINIDLDLLDTNDFRVDGSGVFDLNNDGYLDIVAGYNRNAGNEVNNGINIFWGSESFKYSYEKSTKIDIGPWLAQTADLGVWGITFIDYNLDGLFDIVSTGSGFNNSTQTLNGHLSIHKNLGNNQFENVTTEIVDNYYWKGRENHGDYQDMPFAYAIKVIDYDGDGDYDLVPHGGIIGEVLSPDYNGDWSWENAAGSNIYWENNGGQFTFNHDKVDLLTGCLIN